MVLESRFIERWRLRDALILQIRFGSVGMGQP
jgi:hypothetical protein